MFISLSLKGGFLLDARVIALSITDKNVPITIIRTETAIIHITINNAVGIIYSYTLNYYLYILNECG